MDFLRMRTDNVSYNIFMRKLSLFGYLVSIIYLGYSGFVLYSLKGISWLLVSLLGPLAFFPIWAYFLLGYSEPGVWIMFIYLIFDSFFTNEKKVKQKSEEIYLTKDFDNQINVQESVNPQVIELENKLNEIEEQEKIQELRDKLNQKRIERGLLSLFEFEELENKINDFKATYERKKISRNYAEEKYSYLKPRRNIGTAIFFVPAVYSFYSITNTGIPALVTGTIFWVIGASYFYYLNKKIKFFKNKTEILSSEIKDLEIEIDKNSHILDKNKL